MPQPTSRIRAPGSDAEIASLSESLKQHDMLQPVLVRRTERDGFELKVRVFALPRVPLAVYTAIGFTRPLVMPADVGVYIGEDGALAVGDAPGGPAYLTGRFETNT